MNHDNFFEVIGEIAPTYDVRPFRDFLKFYEEEPIGATHRPKDASSIEEHITILATCIRQVCLARSHELFTGSLGAMAAGNIFSMVALMRAHLETTSVLGHVFRLIDKVHKTPTCASEVDTKLFNLLFGTRNQSLLDAGAPEMSSIMSIIDSADKGLYLLLQKPMGLKNTSQLRGVYDFLSEFAHPNFHSNALAFTFDPVTQDLIFRRREGISEADVEILSHLGISATVFMSFYGALEIENREARPDRSTP